MISINPFGTKAERIFRQKDITEVTFRYVIGNVEAEEFWSGLGFQPVIKTANTSLAELERRLTDTKRL